MEINITKCMKKENLLKKIEDECGENVNLCYQCRTCTSGCPLLFAMDVPPASIMQAIRFSLNDLVLQSNTIWLCASCKTCTSRCPQGIDIAAVMDGARKIAEKEGIAPAVKEIAIFYEAAKKNIRKYGRMHELGLVRDYKLKTLTLTKDMALGLKMLLSGKLKLMPRKPGNMEELKKIFKNVLELEGLL